MLIGGRNVATYGPQYMKYSPYNRLQIQRYAMKQAAEHMQTTQIMSSSMFAATLTQSQGLANLVAKAAAQRIHDATAAKQKGLQSSLDLSA